MFWVREKYMSVAGCDGKARDMEVWRGHEE
jgi:hypothetical protein